MGGSFKETAQVWGGKCLTVPRLRLKYLQIVNAAIFRHRYWHKYWHSILAHHGCGLLLGDFF